MVCANCTSLDSIHLKLQLNRSNVNSEKAVQVFRSVASVLITQRKRFEFTRLRSPFTSHTIGLTEMFTQHETTKKNSDLWTCFNYTQPCSEESGRKFRNSVNDYNVSFSSYFPSLSFRQNRFIAMHCASVILPVAADAKTVAADAYHQEQRYLTPSEILVTHVGIIAREIA